MPITYQQINLSDLDILSKIQITYESSFPKVERRDFESTAELLNTRPDFSAYAIYKGDIYVGFFTRWNLGKFYYIEHIALDESARSLGIGRVMMERIITESELPIVIEVEIPNDELSKRRVGFYVRSGFVLSQQNYQQPPYREEDPWTDMFLMSYGDIDLASLHEEVKKIIYLEVYQIKLL